jgi:uncharacterized spore protein YtfJ
MDRQAPQLQEGLVEHLAEQLTSSNVRTVFGDPVDRKGTTVIPVATVRYGFGGGTGRKTAKDRERGQEGMGGGAGVQVSPVGFIQMTDGEVKFRRIPRAAGLLRLLGLGLGALLLANGISDVLRRRRIRGAIAGLSGSDRRRFVRRLKAMHAG